MVTVEQYRACIQDLLTQYQSQSPPSAEIETQLVCDTERNHYQLVDVGWDGEQRIYSCVLHLDIKDNKIWVQRNMTDRLVAEELVALGIPPDHIVLGLHSPHLRPFTGFAVN